jgi:mono/diheme cytochrome c family protein
MGRLSAVLVVAIVGVCAPFVTACDVPTPLAPAEPIGTFPNWGADFATPAVQPRSLMGAGLGGAPGDAPSPMAGQAMPGAIKDFSGGDPVLGKAIYGQLCARCHGDAGAGGALPGGIAVPALNDPALQGRLTDAQMARGIALGKGAMPSFMQDLDRDKLAAVIAHIRTLK